MFASHSIAENTHPYPNPLHYQWGRGLGIENLNLTLGGYINLTFENNENQADETKLNDLSLFINWSPFDRVRLFAELEMEDLISNQGVRQLSDSFSLERLFIDFLVTDSFSIRFGQFLTPIGIWNELHASPLVWTTSRPISTQSEIFPSRTNGLLFSKQFIVNQHDLDISLYFDNSEHLNPRNIHHKENHSDEIAFQYAIGSTLKYQINDPLTFGFSYLVYKKHASQDNSQHHLIGMDLFWTKHHYEIQMEFTYRQSFQHNENETAGYFQTVMPLGHKLFAITRYEFVDGTHITQSEKTKGTSHIILPALAWRPYIPLVVKAEYRLGKNNQDIAPSGFFTSISMLF